jgi:hypothetical protein
MKKLLTTGKAGQEYLVPSCEVVRVAMEDSAVIMGSYTIPDVEEEEVDW